MKNRELPWAVGKEEGGSGMDLTSVRLGLSRVLGRA